MRSLRDSHSDARHPSKTTAVLHTVPGDTCTNKKAGTIIVPGNARIDKKVGAVTITAPKVSNI